jgi:hypothetical protein
MLGSMTPATIENFESGAIPLAEFNHRAHLTVAYEYLRRYPLEEATRRMCGAVRAYGRARNVPQTPTSGYHQTLTIAWMRVLASVMAAYGPEANAESFLAAHPHLESKVLLRLWYTRERMMSAEARAGWVEPDLAPLPRVEGAGGARGVAIRPEKKP